MSFCVGLLLSACAFVGAGEPVRPNVLIVTIDTCRQDYVRCYGRPLGRTLEIDRLAATGVKCTNAATVAPITLPAHTSILTGLYPPAHGIRDNGAIALSDAVVTGAELFKEAGYETCAVVSAMVLSKLYNLTQGFDVYDDDLWEEDEPEMFMIRDRPAPKTARRFTQWLDGWHARGNGPFFAWVHMFDPHQPLNSNAPDSYLCPTPYDAEIAQADDGVEIIVKWLEERNLLDQTIVVVTSDHGESLGEHKEKTHAIFIYDATIKVPLVWRYPPLLPKGKVYGAPVRAIDILPTVLAAAGVPEGAKMQGVNLLDALAGKADAPNLPQYCESMLSQVGFGMAPLQGVRLDGFKYIRAPRPELYDLKEDPRELKNLYEEKRDVAARLEEQLADIIRQSEAMAMGDNKNVMDAESTEMLEALGYLASTESITAMGGMDPKDGIEIYEMLEQARHQARFNRWDLCQATCQKLLERVPGHCSALNLLATALLKTGRYNDAEAACKKSLEIEPQQHRVVLTMANVALKKGDLEKAEQHVKACLALSPKFADALVRMSYVRRLQGDMAGAEQWMAKAVAEDPKSPRVQMSYAELFYLRGAYAEALSFYEQALKLEPKNFSGLMLAGGCAQKTGDLAKAERYYQAGLKLRGDSWLPHYNMACLRAMQGDTEQAFSLLHKSIDTKTGRRHLRGLLAKDTDLSVLRGHDRFGDLVNLAARPLAGEETLD